ncbi:MAG: hypothetical protein CVV22_12250 [Ignavibacteriae bacterium HGW-Ignavibacteriae-1]|nr:MAG: hypothetical protein CVV22_12250 [Ignavibacteriae bacterium HGW-Ignavibacteriae-1]
MLRLIAIAAFIFAANLNLFAQQDTSIWEQSGNIWLHKQIIGSIRQSGLSSTGDSLWILSHHNYSYYFRIWELKSGLMVHEKRISIPIGWPIITSDMKSIIDYINPAEFKFYDLQTETLIKYHSFFDITQMKVTPEIQIDYNSSKGEVYFAAKFSNISQGYTSSSMAMQIYIMNVGVKGEVGIGPNYVFNNDFTCIAGLNFSHRDITYDQTKYEHTVTYYDIMSGGAGNLYKVYETTDRNYRSYDRLIFTSKPNLLAGFDSESNLTIWDWKLRTTISHSKLKNFKFGSICFTENDEYIAGIRNNRIFLYDFESKNIIDSTDIANTYTKLLYSKSNSLIAFTISNRFGIFDSKLLSTEPHAAFVADSNFVYTGQSVKLYNKSNFEYDAIEWELSDGRTTFHPNPTFTFDTPGMIDVRLRLTKAGKVYEKFVKNFIEVYPLLKADFEVNITKGEAPLVVNFKDLSEGEIIEQSWNFGDLSYSNEKNPTHTYKEAGRYTVTLVVRDTYNIRFITKAYLITVDYDSIQLVQVINNSVFGGDENSLIGTEVIEDSIYIFYANEDVYRIYFAMLHKYKFDVLKLSSNKIFCYECTDLIANKNSEFVFGSSGNYQNVLQTKFFKTLPIFGGNNFEKNIDIAFWRAPITRYYTEDLFLIGGIDKDLKNRILTLDYDFAISDSTTLDYTIIDIRKYTSNDIYALVFNKVDSSYKFIVLDNKLQKIREHDLLIDKDISIKSILALHDGSIAFAGSSKSLFIGYFGVISAEGNFLWKKSVKGWKEFDKLLLNKTNFIVYGSLNEQLVGFIESDVKGENHIDFRIPGISSRVLDIEFIDDSTLVLTRFPTLTSVRYKPLPQSSVSVDTSTKINGSHIILPVPNPAENSVTLQFAEATIVKKVQVYDYSGIEVMQFTYPQSPVYEVQLPLQALSTGMYHVTVTTDSGILRTKFIKY